MEKGVLGSLPLLVFLLVLCLLPMFSKTPAVHVSAAGTTGSIRVYWDAACTKTVQSIDWGSMTLGEAKSFVVYTRNEDNQTCFLNVKTTDWQPTFATKHLNFSWFCDINKFAAEKVARGTLRLQISSSTTGVSTFSFNIVFEASDRLVGDVNRDEYVGMDDLFRVSLETGKLRYDPACDVNNDGYVDVKNAFLVALHYGEEARS